MTAYRVGLTCLFGITAAVAGCRAGRVGEAVRGDPLKAGDQLDGKGKDLATLCKDPAGALEPLVVDWPSSERANLEHAMGKGVAVVALDCEGIRVLGGCQVAGGYEFGGISRKQEALQLAGADEVRANLPLAKVTLSGELSRDATLDLALVIIGLSTTPRAEVSRADLSGGKSCEGATHYVEWAQLGAFVMQRGTRGKVRTAAEVFGAGASAASASERADLNKDGDPAACERASKSDKAPIELCQSPLRLRLSPLDQPQAEGETAAAVVECSEGLTWNGSKCEKLASSAADEPPCGPNGFETCVRECEAGAGPSCEQAVRFIYSPKVPGETEAKRERAHAINERGCALENMRSCLNLARALRMGPRDPERQRRALELLTRGCDSGLADACGDLAVAVEDPDRKVQSAKRLEYAERACIYGAATGCASEANLYLDPKSPLHDEARGVATYEKSCLRGALNNCMTLGHILSGHLTAWKVSKLDGARAHEAYTRACGPTKTNTYACARALDLVADGSATGKRDPEAAFSGWSALCKDPTRAGFNLSCIRVGEALATGTGTAADPARAIGMLESTCFVGVPHAGCLGLARAYAAEGPAQDRIAAARAYEEACRKDASTCAEAAKFIKPIDAKKAKTLADKACKARGGGACK